MVPLLAPRREFLKLFAISALPKVRGLRGLKSNRGRSGAHQRRFFFTSPGKWPTGQGSRLGLMQADGTGTGLRELKFDVPNQALWQPYAFFSDGGRVILASLENANADG